jgi:hypothetical protein
MADVKDLLRARFAPVPLHTGDASLDGLLFIRRLRVSELRRYLDCVSGGKEKDQNLLLLSLSVCDAEGNAVFASPEEADELLGDLYIEATNQVAALTLGEPEKNLPRAKSRRAG